MSQDDHQCDPLLRAIGEMRRELLGWIDERIAMLRQRPAGPEVAATAAVPPVPPRDEAVDRGIPRPVLVPPPAAVRPPAEEGARRADGDPRERLNNLARHLGERLKLADPRGPEPEPAERTNR